MKTLESLYRIALWRAIRKGHAKEVKYLNACLLGKWHTMGRH